MAWPWVSRLAYDLLLDERNRLRDKNDEADEHIRRITRKQEGLTESPREPKKKVEPIPIEIERIIMGFDNEQTRSDMRNHARIARHRDGTPWSVIQANLEANT